MLLDTKHVEGDQYMDTEVERQQFEWLKHMLSPSCLGHWC